MAAAPTLFGDVADIVSLTADDGRPIALGWHMGTIDRDTWTVGPGARAPLAELRRLLKLPSCQFVRDLELTFHDAANVEGALDLLHPAYTAQRTLAQGRRVRRCES